MLPMLTFEGVPGLLYLNGRLCGETGRAAFPIAPDGIQYLELRPFDPEARGATLRLDLREGRLACDLPEGVYAVQWPGGWIAMELPDARAEMARASVPAREASPQPHASPAPIDVARAWLEATRRGEGASYLANPQRQAEFSASVGAFDAMVELPPDGRGEVAWGLLRLCGENVATVSRATFGFTADLRIEAVTCS